MDIRKVIKNILMALDASQKLGRELSGVLCSDNDLQAFYRIESPLIDALMEMICPEINDHRSDRVLDISMNYEMDMEERSGMLLKIQEEVRGNYVSDAG